HCSLRRLRSPSSSSFPHVYLLVGPQTLKELNPQAKAKQQQERQQRQQQQQHQHLLLVALKNSEHSTVHFFLPTDAVAAAAEALFAADDSSSSRRDAAQVGAAAQQLLQLVQQTFAPNDFSYVGSLICNFWGTLARESQGNLGPGGHPQAPERSSSSSNSSWGSKGSSNGSLLQRLPHSEQRVLAKLSFSRNLSGDVPRKMKAELNRDGGVYALEPLPPRWDPKLGSYSLPFYGRARLPSAKNFQMVLSTGTANPQGAFASNSLGGDLLQNTNRNSDTKNQDALDDHQKEIFFMLGKVEKDDFCLDFRWPVQALEAFAMAAAALAKKRVVS
ncbi:tubby-like F-box protein 6, partial [Cyclospora cayetanensis]|uniref:Tubby-like F-box protein 6 n=1 Tax=Cyclospora cayetanensis TaxID=88456 RepID=A0A6P6S5F4_9EIME